MGRHIALARLLLGAAALAWPLLTPAASWAAPPATNTICPVTDEPVEPEFVTIYKGRKVQFCCTTCLADFKKDPKKYVKDLPQFANLEQEQARALQEGGDTDADESTGGAFRPPRRESATRRIAKRSLPFFAVAIPLFLAWQIARRKRERARSKLVMETVLFLEAGALVVAIVSARYYRDERDAYQDRDKVHFATYYDFGSPPSPVRPERPKQLGGTFYRGNDERNPRLFNGGYYRTSTFQLGLVDGEGRPVAVGAPVAGQKLFVRYDVARAPFTHDHFFSPEAMKVIFLTRDGSPFLERLHRVEDRLAMDTLEPMQKWRADFPIGAITKRSAKGPNLATASVDELARVPGVGKTAAEWLVAFREHNRGIRKSADIDAAGIEGRPRHALSRLLEEDVLEGTLYVAQTILKDGSKGPPLGARFHYGIHFDLHAKDGVLTEDSDLWMSFLYRSRKVAKSLIPDEQWFSIHPIPELPAKGTDDPTLLGVDEFM